VFPENFELKDKSLKLFYEKYQVDKAYVPLQLSIMKQFTIPFTYRSPLLGAIKKRRKLEDKMKKDFSPFLLDFGEVKIFLARHFGFCYGVENAIEIAFRTLEENKGKRIFLLSEMIHNPVVNEDLIKAGVLFIQDTNGKQIIPFESLTKNDIVLIPAFGTTLDIENILRDIGITIEKYDTTCPFVEKVWNRSIQIGENNYSVIIHGKPTHEETRATFSHAAKGAPSLVIKNIEEAKLLGTFISENRTQEDFNTIFKARYSEGFDLKKDLDRIGVVNQTTMLASDTQGIADYLKKVMVDKYGLTEKNISERFADTRDTLCYATNDNQSSVYELLNTSADAAIIIGGYNSSNTSHLVDLCMEKLPSFFINGPDKVLSSTTIEHYNFEEKREIITEDFLPNSGEVRLLITSGASCPDAVVEKVIEKIIEVRKTVKKIPELLAEIN